MDQPDLREGSREKRKLLLLSVVTTFLSLLPTAYVAMISNSVTLWTDLLRCIAEFLSIFLSWLVIRRASRPSGATHNYGLGKLEQLASLGVALGLLVTFLVSLFAAYERFRHPEPLENPLFGLILSVFSIAGNSFLWIRNAREARRTPSPVMDSQRRLFRSKTMASLVVFCSLSAGLLGSQSSWSMFVDPLGSLLLSCYLLHAAYGIVSHSVGELIDSALDESLQLIIMRTLVKNEHLFSGFREVKSRRSGTEVFITLYLEFASSMTVGEMQRSIAMIERDIRSEIPHSTVDVVTRH